MDRDKFNEIIGKLGEVRQNSDARPGDRRATEQDSTHGLVLINLTPGAHHCGRCDLVVAGKPANEYALVNGSWEERCVICRKLYDPHSGEMVTHQQLRRSRAQAKTKFSLLKSKRDQSGPR